MDVRFIDTTILANILDIPFMNQNRGQVIEEFKSLQKDENQVLILPLATIIETGNHIAHISDGNIRREKAKLMSEYLKNTAENNAPWQYYGKELDKEDLIKLSIEFPDMATREVGLGDLSIVRAYEKYKKSVPAIRNIMIWSLDNHLVSYKEEMKLPTRRRNL
ncbi:hypothetical protein [Sporanaerobacter acetigenes]|uniref:hypothetical protein n=1 Tax=Sporanaerobacter acetigenes TaxID=165813 RepID=UPI00332DABF8